MNHGQEDLQPTREGKELMQKMALCNAVISQVRNLNSDQLVQTSNRIFFSKID
jgi:predicted transcriptional regulator